MYITAGTSGARAIQLDVYRYIKKDDRSIITDADDQNIYIQKGLLLLVDMSPRIVIITKVASRSTITVNDKLFALKSHINTTSEKNICLDSLGRHGSIVPLFF